MTSDTPRDNGADRSAVRPRQRGSTNWVHGSLGVTQDDDRGLGVVALDGISQGTLLIMYGGKVITDEEFATLSDDMKHFPFQVADHLYLGPMDESDVGLGERVNHSCSPNAGFSGAIALIALRDISEGEAITMDYATCIASCDAAFTMECKCGAVNCRRRVTGSDWQLPSVQERLLPFYQPFLQEKVSRMRAAAEGSVPQYQCVQAE